MTRVLKRGVTLLAALAISSCATTQSTESSAPLTAADTAPDQGAVCSEAPAGLNVGTGYGPMLSGDAIHLVNWNAQKNGGTGIHEDLTRLSAQADILLLQEAVVDDHYMRRLDPAFHWVFAPGYVAGETQTGVLTASRVKPLSSCNLRSREPWLRSPKATGIARYPIEGRAESLLVVNVHLINFTLGLEAMSLQLAAAVEHIEAHEGPVIVSGDFNTWSTVRNREVLEIMSSVGLEPVEFDQDQRTRFFGNAVDHVYVRGLRAYNASAHPVDSSDHNPLEVWLELF